MQAVLLIAVALAGQTTTDRYTTPDADAAAPAQSSSALIAEPETPEPKLESTDAAAYQDPAGTPDLADDEIAPLGSAPPADSASSSPPAVAAAAGAADAAPQSTAPPAEATVVKGNAVRPTETIAQLLSPPATGQLAGVPLTLGDALLESRSREDQTARAKAYWDLAASVGEFYLASLERTQLGALRDGIAAPSAAWDAKIQEYEARAAIAKQTALAAQRRLQKLLGAADPPIPTDVPHCGRYNTEYKEIFGQQPNLAAKQLDELLPLRYEQLRSQARAIAEAHQWLEQVAAARDPNTDGTGVLQAYDLMSLRRRAFLTTARDYNQEIAAYIELAAPAQVAPDRMVAMMIRTSAGDASPPWENSGVRQASAAEDAEPAAKADGAATESGASAPPVDTRTYRQVRRPLQRLFGREKSIVVQRLLQRRGGDRND